VTGFPPEQEPLWHVSVCVHALPSSHAVPFDLFAAPHTPWVHEATWQAFAGVAHWLGSLQFTQCPVASHFNVPFTPHGAFAALSVSIGVPFEHEPITQSLLGGTSVSSFTISTLPLPLH